MPSLSLPRLAEAQPALFKHGVALLVMAVLCVPALWLDGRSFNGINVWIKPIKFQLSAAVYLLTLCACFLALPQGADRTRSGRYVVGAAIAMSWFEVIYISIQAARGQASHWNFTNAFTIAMYSLMGLGALVLASTGFVQALMIRRQRSVAIDPTLRHALVTGLLMSFVLGAGFGAVLGGSASHWVGGTASDANGLPLFGWSRDGGDLRVAHFFGLHAMQFVPAFGWAAMRWLPVGAQRMAVNVFAVALAVFTVATFVQARMGRPFIGL
jgi:hypothetical protein